MLGLEDLWLVTHFMLAGNLTWPISRGESPEPGLLHARF